MSTHRRIASLFRELADAFDELEAKRKPRSKARLAPQADFERAFIDGAEVEQLKNETTERVRRGLRRVGVRA